MAERIPARLTPAQGRRFGLTVGLAFMALAGLALWRGRHPAAIVFGSLGGVLVLAALIIPAQLGPVERAWMGLGHALSRVTSPIFLGIVFYLCITPIGFLMRLFGSAPLARPARGTSGWIARTPETRRRLDMQRQF
ncbi:MAG TPA: SxtJ family membrane protein [Gemmatimonadales bacterium]|nr:SxtJ family membrane protein [Gemmatimonadales bacterium]